MNSYVKLLHSHCPTLVKVGKKELGKDQRKKLKGIEIFFALLFRAFIEKRYLEIDVVRGVNPLFYFQLDNRAG